MGYQGDTLPAASGSWGVCNLLGVATSGSALGVATSSFWWCYLWLTSPQSLKKLRPRYGVHIYIIYIYVRIYIYTYMYIYI